MPVEGTWRSHQVPLGRARGEPRAPRAARGVDALATGPEELFDDDGAPRPELAALAPRGRPAHERQPARQRRRCCCGTSSCPTSATTPSRSRRRAADEQRGDARARRLPARRDARATRRTFRDLRARRDRVQPAAARVRGRPTAPGWPRAWPTDDHLAPDGRVHGGAVRAPLPGLARGLPADRPARPVQLLRGVHPHHRLDVQPAREVAEDDPRASRGGGRSRRSTTCCQLARLAPGPQRLLPPGPGLHRPRRQQEGRDHPRLPAARRQLPAVGRPTTACAVARLRQRDRGRQAAGARLPARWTRRSCTARAASASGSGRRTDDGDEPDVVLGVRGDIPTLETLAAVGILREHLPDLKVRVDQRRRPDAPAGRDASTRTACPTASSTRCSPTTGR